MIPTKKYYLFFSVMILIFAFIIGCSGNGNSPLAPNMPSDETIARIDTDAIEGIANGILGAYHVSVNAQTYEYEIFPARSLSAIGDIALPDVTKHFISDPCADCFGIDSIGLTSEGYLDMVIKMKHPYARDIPRQDLDVFDVRGIMIVPGDTTFDALPYIDINGDGFVDEPPKGNFDMVVNADGYTSYYDNVAEDLFGLDLEGNLNPFRRFFIGNNPNPDIDGAQIPWHRMQQGSPFDKKRYILNLEPGQILDFVFVIDCAYGQSALFGIPPGEPGSRDNPMYFNPEFNRKEAYSVKVDPVQNLTAGDTNSSTDITIYVKDWQNSQSPGWDMEDPSSIRYRSDVASVTMSVPDITDNLFNKTSPDSGNGTNNNPYVFSFDVQNTLGAEEGEYTGLIAVTDQYQEDGRMVYGTTTSVRFTNFTFYKAVKFTVEEGFHNTDPVAVADAEPNPVESGQMVSFIDEDSYDPDPGDTIIEYAWQFDWDGGAFNPDVIDTQPNQASYIYHNTTGQDIEITARLRVKDNHHAVGYDSVIITIQPSDNTPPVAVSDADPNPANHNQRVNFIDIDSYDDDPGDSIVEYAWDFDWDGNPINFNVDSSSEFPNQAHTTYQNTSGSDIEVTAGLRVKDSHGAFGYDSVTVTVRTQPTDNNPPIARANANPNPVTSGRTVQLIDILSEDPDPGDYIANYKWIVDVYQGIDWNNPDYESDTPNSASHIYYNTGLDPVQFTARLRVYDSHGAWNDDNVTITVNPNQLPVAVCDANPNPTRGGLEVQLIDEDSYDQDPQGWIILYEWDVDYDGQDFNVHYSSNQPNRAKHIYENTTGAPITYTAALRVTDNSLTTDICTIDITVESNSPPVAAGYTTPDPQYAGYDVTFHAENSYDPDPGDSIARIEWDFDWDGDPANFSLDWSSTDVNATTTHVYENSTPDPIEYKAGLKVYDESGLYDIDEVIVTIDPEIPEPIIYHWENQNFRTVGKQYLFKSFNTSSGNLSWTDGPWDFTGIATGGSYTEQFVNPDTDPDFAQFRADYPDATGVLKLQDTVNGGYALAPYTFEDISAPDSGYQVEFGQENSMWGELASMKFENPVRIPFPMQMGYYEFLVASGSIAEVQPFTITFNIVSVGHGLCTTEYGTFNALLVRTYTVLSMPGSGLPDSKYVSYEWIADDGTKLATATTQNFDETTYLPIGMIKGGGLYQVID